MRAAAWLERTAITGEINPKKRRLTIMNDSWTKQDTSVT